MDYDDAGSENNSSGSTPTNFAHTMTELEDEANKIVIKQCKIEACLDIFLSGVRKIARDRSVRLSYWEPSFEGIEGDELETLKTKLRENMDRLLPGTCQSDVPALECGAVKSMLEKKWRGGHTRQCKETADFLRPSLFEGLMEKQARQRSMRAQDDLHDSATDTASTIADYCRQLKDLIDGEEATHSFSCGGTIHVDSNAAHGPADKPTSPPVNVFWSPNNDTSAHKLVLPLGEYTPEAFPGSLQGLVSSCDIASFGLGEEDVIDEAYRKAGKLNPDQFATSFHPADFGILENIEQVLLPSISDELDNRLQFRKIKAELYKFNAYSAPSGLFRKHVDTPRSESQIGSLVVCLPSVFEGGSLVVQHSGQTVEFDWGPQSSSTIQWAAFYSDCEHEIKTVTSGDRITLTYNLYVTEPIGNTILAPTSIVDPKSLPLHSWIKKLLAQPDFMKEGGVLGMFCSHVYPHTSELASLRLPRALKGTDLVLYSVFKSLGIELAIAPIFSRDGVYAKNRALDLKEKADGRDSLWTFDFGDRLHNIKQYLKHDEPLKFKAQKSQSADFDCSDVDQLWKWLLMTRKVPGMEDAIDYAIKNDLPLKPNSFYAEPITLVGKGLAPYTTTDWDLDSFDDTDELVNQCIPVTHIPGITWVTEPKHEEMAFSHIAYGNEPSISNWYSCVAILAAIPPTESRVIVD